ncbi:hypothetical protein V5F44_04695 [Xanthobacter sp. V2C-8]|uniref:hypothetical protein n=1 Tax=Xanthobacter albus TaxID=3119929 RepID=UPI003726235E
MSSPMSALEAARALAAVTQDGERELNDLLIQKFILPKLEAISGLDAARASFKALGPAPFRAYALRMADAKVRKVLEACGGGKAAIKPLSGVEIRNLLEELASGARDTYAPEPRPSRSAPAARTPKTAPSREPKPPATLPDVRALYRSGGTEALYKAIKPLKVAELRAVITDQGLKLPSKAGAKKDDLLKSIQTAVRDELGVRGDWVGAVARKKDDADEA